MKKLFALSLMTLLFAVTGASAEVVKKSRQSGSIKANPAPVVKLQPTLLGDEMGAEGYAQMHTDASAESLVVKVFAKVKDGTVLIVSCTDQQEQVFDVGAVEMRLGSGALLLNSLLNDASPAFPLNDLTHLTVRIGDEPLLQGKLVTNPR